MHISDYYLKYNKMITVKNFYLIICLDAERQIN